MALPNRPQKKEKLSIPDNYCHTLRPEHPGSWIGTLFAIE